MLVEGYEIPEHGDRPKQSHKVQAHMEMAQSMMRLGQAWIRMEDRTDHRRKDILAKRT